MLLLIESSWACQPDYGMKLRAKTVCLTLFLTIETNTEASGAIV